MTYYFLSSAYVAWGAEESLVTLAASLSSQGEKCTLLTSNEELSKRWLLAQIGEAHIMTRPRAAAPRAVAAWYAQSRHILKLAGAEDRIVVFSTELSPLGFAIRLETKAEVVLDLHDYLPTRGGRAKLKLFSRGFDRVIAVSSFAASQSANKRTAVLTRPVSTRAQTNSIFGQSGGVIAVVGRIDRDKRLELALSAIQLLPPIYSLSVRGAPSSDPAYAEALRLNSDSARVTWTGRLPAEELYSGVDVLLVCNHQEAMGRSVLEAQIAGVPVVAPDAGGAAELIEDGVSGVTYVAGDAKSAAEAICRAIDLGPDLIRRAAPLALMASNPTVYAETYSSLLK